MTVAVPPRTRLGLDLGANSIGWCLVPLDETGAPSGVTASGVLLLTPNQEAGRDPQSKASLAGDRRVKRSMRKRRDRFVRRRDRLMETLIAAGLMPVDEAERKALEPLDPYAIRARAVSERVEAHELGRALFHLNQRRGFRSNRIADGDDKEKGAMRAGMRALEDALAHAGVDTLGQYQHRELERWNKALKPGADATKEENRVALKARQGVRFRPRHVGAKVEYPLYPHRDMVEDELRLMLNEQAKHHAAIDDALKARLHRIIIEQRPLKPQVVGRCTFRPEEDRAPKAHPLFQRFRILSDLANLRIETPGVRSRRLRMEERDALASLLATRASLAPFESLRKALKLPGDARFNYEKIDRKGFEPDLTAARLAKAYGKQWRSLPRALQAEVVEHLLTVEDNDALVAFLKEALDCDDETAERMGATRLPDGHSSLGRSILSDLVDVMESEATEDVDPSTGEVFRAPLNYDEAVDVLGLHHSDHRPGELLPALPYYGEILKRHVIERPGAPEGSQERIGRVPNPTVHIALNQTRKLVNAIIAEYGRPGEMVIELGRELKWNKERKDDYEKQLKKNTQDNERRKAELEALNTEYGLGVEFRGEARIRMRLYDELPADEKVCIYSGKQIGMHQLFNGEVEIDHILPFSQTLDDGMANKVLCFRDRNREKGARAPADVPGWRGGPLEEIAERAERLFPHKAWRFLPDAMDRFQEKRGFIDRHMVDTQHLARLTKDYIGHVVHPDRVWAVPGKMTAMLRGLWGLNSLLSDHNAPPGKKNRTDHRHHAIDAFVLACTHRSLLNEIARRAGRVEDQDGARLLDRETVPEPFDGYRDALRASLDAIVVSHKPDHKIDPKPGGGPRRATGGRLHEETAFGLVDEEIDGEAFGLVTRKPLTALTEKEIDQVRDRRLRDELRALRDTVRGDAKKADKKELAAALQAYAEENGVRRVRVLKRDTYRVIEHGRNPKGGAHRKAYAPGDNHCVEIYQTSDGRWAGEGVTMFDAHRPEHRAAWRNEAPGARLVMRLHKNDMIEADFDGERKIYRVTVLEPSSKRVRIAAHNEAGSLDDRHKDPDDPFERILASYTKLQAAGARRVKVDALGRVKSATDR